MKKWLLLIFSFLLLLWFWSKDGIMIRTKITKVNSVINIYFDNFLLGSALDNSSEKKKLTVNFSKQDLDSIYFNNQPKTNKNNILFSKNDYELTFLLTNPFLVRLSFLGNKPYVFYFNPYRHLNSGWEDKFNVLENKINNRPQISFINGIKWLLWIVLKPFPFIIPLFFIMYLFGKTINRNISSVNFIRTKNKFRYIFKSNINLKILIIPLIICLISFFWSRYLMKNYLQDSPHVPDSISYVILGKLLSSGKFIISFSDLPTFLKTSLVKDYFYHYFNNNNSGLFVPYLLGHPLILALGNIFGLINFIPPFIGSISLLFIFLISYILSQSFVFSIISMLLCFASPFFQTQTIDYMSHNSAALFILIGIFPLFLNKEWSKYFLLTGFFLGLLLNARPLTFVAVLISTMIYLLVELFNHRKYKIFFLKLFYSLIGSIIPISIFLYYNYATSGNIFTTPYQFHGILNKVGFGSDFKIGYGLLNTFSNLAVFSLFFLRNYFISFFPLLLSFLILPFTGKYLKKIIFLQFLSLLIIGVWTLYDGNFFMYGPRFIYEAVPVLAILYGITFYFLFSALKQTRWNFISYLIIVIYFINIFSFELSWLGKKQPEYSGIVFVPSNIIELKGFNESDGRFLDIYNKNKNRDKVFLMKKCENWWCYSGFWLNQFPINKSKPLFLTLPDNYQSEIKSAEIIDWNSL